MNRVGHVMVQPGDRVKRSAPGPMPVLVAFLVLTSIVPSRLVVPGLGAAGRPANLLAVAMLMWWVLLMFAGAAGMWVLLYWSLLAVMVFYVGWTCILWAKRSG